MAAPSQDQPLRILGLQLDFKPGDTHANCRRAEALIKRHPGHRLYVLPELHCNGYCGTVLEAVAVQAQHAETGTIATFFSRLAREVDAYICYGFLRRRHDSGAGGDPVYTICQAVVRPDGVLALVYDKMHLCDMGACSEVSYGCTRGTQLGVFECDGVTVGVTVCYDIRFPELFRELAWGAGCDVILHPSAFVRDATFHCYHAFCTTRAVENAVYFLSVNIGGPMFGDSIAVPPWIGPVPGIEGSLAASSLGTEQKGVLALTVDPAVLRAVRAAYPYRRDVSPALRSQL